MNDRVRLADCRWLDIDGGRIEYRDIAANNEADATTKELSLTLLHEGLGCVALWRNFPQELNEALGFRVLAYSRFGYGGSDTVSLPRPITYMHDEATNHLSPILDAMDVSDTILVGHSDGASIAAIYAGEIEDPRVRGLVLISPHFFCEDVSINSIRNARTQWETGLLKRQLARYHGDNVDTAFLGWNDAWLNGEFSHWNIESSLNKIIIPILGIQRSEDPYGSRRQLETIVSQSDAHNRSIHFIDGTGHAPHIEESEKTIELIRDFCMTITDRTGEHQ